MEEKRYPLYSLQAIGTATMLGSPLSAGILLRRNYLNLGRPVAAKVALAVGIASTLFLIVGIFIIPEPILDKVPNMVIPFFNGAVVSFVVWRIQGKELEQHQTEGNPFYSAWRSIGIALSCCGLILGGIVGYVFLIPDTFDTELYQQKMELFQQNEKNALRVYGIDSPEQVVSFVETTGIPKWKENEQIVLELNKLDGLPEDMVEENKQLLEYVRLRIKHLEMFSLLAQTDDRKYIEPLAQLDRQIDSLLTLSEQK